MKNQHLDSKTLWALCKTSTFLVALSFSIIFIPQFAFAEVTIPTDEYIGYFDSNGVYTVVGNVKNELSHAIVPSITVSVMYDGNIFSKEINHVPLAAGTEIPFKVKFPEVLDAPILLAAELSYDKTNKTSVPIDVLYDETLIKHEDGHLSGRIQNVGNATIYNPKVFAVVHGYEQVLDIVQNMEFIEKIEPGEIIEFYKNIKNPIKIA